MKIVFLSNYFNHHQSFVSDCIFENLKENFHFISTEPIPDYRKALGYCVFSPTYEIKSFENESLYKKAIQLINEADAVIVGSAPEKMIKDRIKSGKLTLRYSERLFKKGFELWKFPYRFIKFRINNPAKKRIYMLCASAYTSNDYSKYGLFKNKYYKWGYFPEIKQYENIDKLIESKSENSILWAGRFIEWKHPELAVDIAEKLKSDGYDFKLKLIGTGDFENKIKDLIFEKHLENNVCLLGALKPQQVREYMEKSEIFLFTSDFNEGWGAVLNESMNSACAVVASHAIGSVPYLIKDKENGLIHRNCDLNDLYGKVKFLLDNRKERVLISKKAYETMVDKWNPSIAVSRLLELIESIIKGETLFDKYNDGPCSKAEKLKNNWY